MGLSFSSQFLNTLPGVAEERSTASTKTVIVTIFLTCLVFHAMYNASLTSFLAVHRTTMPYNDIQELYLYSNHKIVTLPGTSYIETLRTGSYIEKKLHDERLTLVPTVEEGIKRVAFDENSAFLWTTTAVNHLLGLNCTHSKIPKCFTDHPTEAWAFRKDFPFAGFIRF